MFSRLMRVLLKIPGSSEPRDGLNGLAPIPDVLTSWAQVPAPSLCCPFRIFLFYLLLKLFTLIKLSSSFWQNPVPGGILKKSHVELK